MPDIDITRSHQLGHEGARRAADAVAERLRQQYRIRSDWAGDTLRVSGVGVRGELFVTPEAVRITARLGLLARPFRNQLREEIEQELDRTLSPA